MDTFHRNNNQRQRFILRYKIFQKIDFESPNFMIFDKQYRSISTRHCLAHFATLIHCLTSGGGGQLDLTSLLT